MKGLLVKDFLIIRPQLKVYMLMLAFFAAVSLCFDSEDFRGGFLIGLLSVIPIAVPFTCAALDGQSRWDSFCPALPVSRAAIAGERYLFSLIVTALCCALGAAVSALFGARSGENLEVVLGMAAVPVCINSVMLPIVFRFGVERARILFIGLMFAAYLLFSLLSANAEVAALLERITLPGLLAAAAALFGVSLLVSVGIVRKKEY